MQGSLLEVGNLKASLYNSQSPLSWTAAAFQAPPRRALPESRGGRSCQSCSGMAPSVKAFMAHARRSQIASM
eukprot:1001638-Pyramimonas_sp.AAC.1